MAIWYMSYLVKPMSKSSHSSMIKLFQDNTSLAIMTQYEVNVGRIFIVKSNLRNFFPENFYVTRGK